MTQKATLQEELSKTTKSFGKFFSNPEPATKTRYDNYTEINFDASAVSSKSTGIDIDDILSEFDDNQEVQEALERASKWMAEQYYSEESSIKALRLRKGMSQQQLAEAIGSKQSYVSRVEKGCEDLRASSIKKLAEALDVEPSIILKSLD